MDSMPGVWETLDRKIGTRARLRGALAAALALFGLALAFSGLALALDLFSLRIVLRELDIDRLLAVVLRLHGALEHSGAQVVELAAGLAGLGLLGITIWLARHAGRGGRQDDADRCPG
jgi:hypothetical protein